MKRVARTLTAIFTLGWALLLAAADLDYGLAPEQIAPDTWVLTGRSEDFSTQNGGNIVNTAFVVTSAGVLVIDSGPSRAYGEQLRRAIAPVTDKPAVMVVDTHHHPDHLLGNHAFPKETLAALPGTIHGLATTPGSASPCRPPTPTCSRRSTPRPRPPCPARSTRTSAPTPRRRS